MTIEAPYLAVGTVLKDRYEILREIGRGGYSVVFAARDRELNTDVAVKLLVPPPAVAHIARERMRREVQAARGLSHQHIVAIHDFIEDGPHSFIVMELVDGSDLGDRVARRGTLSIDEVARIGNEIADALAFAHARGVVHRDVKPQNLLIDHAGQARLADFGSAKLDDQVTMTQTGGLVGTIRYTAPEILSGQRGDARADVYALGLTLFYALTGQLPGGSASRGSTPAAAAGHRPSAIRADVPDWLDQCVARATAADPSRRFPRALDLGDALSRREHGSAVLQLAEGGPADFCLSCGSSDSYGMSPCPACGGARPRNADTLVFVVPPSTRQNRREVALRLLEMSTGPVSHADLRQATQGRRAIIRVPARRAADVVRRLSTRNIPAQAVPRNHAWAAVPLPLYALAGTIIVVGSLAGLLAAPVLLWTSPAVAGLLLLGGQRVANTPILEAPKNGSAGLPGATAAAVAQTMGSLESGTTRRMVADILNLGQGVAADMAARGKLDQRADILELLTRVNEAARDLARVERALGMLDEHGDRLADQPADWLDAMTQCERARDRRVQQLLEVLSVLARLKARGSLEAAESEAELTELTSRLERDMEAAALAEAEIEALLADGQNEPLPAVS